MQRESSEVTHNCLQTKSISDEIERLLSAMFYEVFPTFFINKNTFGKVIPGLNYQSHRQKVKIRKLFTRKKCANRHQAFGLRQR